jgi:hypothetical protein
VFDFVLVVTLSRLSAETAFLVKPLKGLGENSFPIMEIRMKNLNKASN